MKIYYMYDVFKYCTNSLLNKCDTKTKYNKLNKILEFLDKYQEYRKYYFFKDVLNIKFDKLYSKFDGRKMNFESIIFLSCLLENEDLPFFKKLLKDKYFTEKESEEWLLAINETLSRFKIEYEKRNKNWDSISTVMQSIFYEFTITQNLNDIDERIINMCIDIVSLPDDWKKKLLDNSIRTRVTYIEKKIKDTIDKLDSHERALYNIDRNMYKDKNKYIKVGINNKKRIDFKMLNRNSY
ncbi:hypothetical protein P7A73_11415 [Clostridium perfringens]|nr:hypothetical protein [Clostridium perfringens]MDK0727407.1 hypothetical protein [Clostridium perfringens]